MLNWSQPYWTRWAGLALDLRLRRQNQPTMHFPLPIKNTILVLEMLLIRG